MYTATLQTRDFTQMAQLPLELNVKQLSWSIFGGADSALIRVDADYLSLFDLGNYLRCPVTITNDYGQPVWWGYINELTLSFGQHRIGVSLDDLANRVAVRYAYLGPVGNLGEIIHTPWAESAASQAVYGVKELIVRQGEIEEDFAVQLRNLTLAEREYPPVSMVGLNAREQAKGRATLKCLGWMHSLGWKYYRTSAGMIANVVGQNSTQTMGDDSTTARLAQSFTPAVDLVIQSAEIRLRKELTPSDAVQVHIKTDSGGSPSSTSLGYVSISNAVLEESSFPMMKVSFDPVISLTGGIKYWIVIQRSGSYSATDHYVVGVDEALSFTGGQFKIYNASTSAWGLRSPNCDLIFRLIGIKQTTLQLADIYTASNQFMTGLIVEPGTNVYTLPYYYAAETSLQVFEKLLRLGTSRKRLVLAEVKMDRQLVITEQPVQGEEDYFIDEQGVCYDAFHNPLLPGFTPVGHWLRFSKPVQVGVKLHDPHLPSAFIVSAQLDVETEKTELGSITP